MIGSHGWIDLVRRELYRKIENERRRRLRLKILGLIAAIISILAMTI